LHAVAGKVEEADTTASAQPLPEFAYELFHFALRFVSPNRDLEAEFLQGRRQQRRVIRWIPEQKARPRQLTATQVRTN
jgi:hypothetical protein